MWLFKDKPQWRNPVYNLAEEIANGVTHGLGAILSVVGFILLVFLAAIYGDTWRVVSFSIYGSSLILLYLASTFYHSIQNSKAKRILRKIDHASIYILIAGTYTPFMLVSMRSPLGWMVLIAVWGMALAGIIWKIFFLGRLEVITTILYLLMGWMGGIIFIRDIGNIPPLGVGMLVAGGVTYTLGVIFYAWEKLPYNHTIWHLFVLGGSICHYFAVVTLVSV